MAFGCEPPQCSAAHLSPLPWAHAAAVGRRGDKSDLRGRCLNALISGHALPGKLEAQWNYNPPDTAAYSSDADLRVNKTVVKLQYPSQP